MAMMILVARTDIDDRPFDRSDDASDGERIS